ncbi:MAG: hypothetical protein ACI9YB_003507 [Halioglobus sp.]
MSGADGDSGIIAQDNVVSRIVDRKTIILAKIEQDVALASLVCENVSGKSGEDFLKLLDMVESLGQQGKDKLVQAFAERIRIKFPHVRGEFEAKKLAEVSDVLKALPEVLNILIKNPSGDAGTTFTGRVILPKLTNPFKR